MFRLHRLAPSLLAPDVLIIHGVVLGPLRRIAIFILRGKKTAEVNQSVHPAKPVGASDAARIAAS